MPYIIGASRARIDSILGSILENAILLTEGELNYIITRLLLSTRPQRYADYNKLMGVLECVKQEFYRRAIAPYEDKKINDPACGDVY